MYSLQIFSTTQDRLSCALCSQAPWHGGAVARGVRSARLAFCSRAAHVPSRIQAPVILPKHSPVRPRLNCFLTFNCSRVPCSELTSSRSTREDLRAHPATIAVEFNCGVRSLNSNTPPRPGSMTLGRLYLKVVICAWMRTWSAPELGPARSLKLCPS